MRIVSSLILTLFTIVTFATNPVNAESTGKADLGVCYLHIDVIKGNNTEKKMDLPAIKADATVRVYGGFCIKPAILYGEKDGSIFSTGIGFGHFIPINDKLCITPSIGVTYTDLETDLKDFNEFYGILHFDTKFESTAPYVNLDFVYKVCEGLRLNGYVQYSWSRSHSKYKEKNLPIKITSKSRSEGFNYGGMVEYDINNCWSINAGAAYNNSLSKEKDGIRGFGTKLGIARWF